MNTEKMSHQQLLDWFNKTVKGEYEKIEDLRSGAAYCQMMEMLFPNCLGGVYKINKRKTELECVYIHNLELLQEALSKLQFNVTVPIEYLVKGDVEENFQFAKWFKKFFDVHLRSNEHLLSAAESAPQPIRRPEGETTGKMTKKMC